MMSLLEFTRGQVAEGRMPALSVVEQLDVFEQRAAGLLARAPLSLVDQLDFERGEETLGHRVVPAVSDPAHAAQDSVCRQQLPVFPAGVLAATDRVVQLYSLSV